MTRLIRYLTYLLNREEIERRERGISARAVANQRLVTDPKLLTPKPDQLDRA